MQGVVRKSKGVLYFCVLLHFYDRLFEVFFRRYMRCPLLPLPPPPYVHLCPTYLINILAIIIYIFIWLWRFFYLGALIFCVNYLSEESTDVSGRQKIIRESTQIVFEVSKLTWYSFIQINRQTDEQTNRQTDKQTNRQTDKQTNRQTDKQTNRQTDKQKNVRIFL